MVGVGVIIAFSYLRETGLLKKIFKCSYLDCTEHCRCQVCKI
jgi:hypothetical protein